MLDIKILKQYSQEELFERLRRVCLMGQINSLVYKDAVFSLEENVSPNEICIPQTYVLEANLRNILNLWLSLKMQGVDIFLLRGFVKVEVDYGGGNRIVRDVLPPVVECSVADGCIKLLNDGMHRLFLPWWMKRRLNVVYISGASHPYYAFPFEGSLSSVRVIPGSVKPEGFDGKRYRLPGKEYKKLFRDFNSVFENVTFSRRKEDFGKDWCG